MNLFYKIFKHKTPDVNPPLVRDPIIESVRAKLLDRSTFGLSKYGVGLCRTDLSRLQWLRHAQEEAMDLAGYLEVLIQQEEKAIPKEPQPNWINANSPPPGDE